MPKEIEKQVSIIGSSYFQPIADLVDRLLKYEKPGPNAVQSGHYESGYSTSIILLLVAMFESYMVRVRYVHEKEVPKNMRSALEVLLHLYPRFSLKKALTDVYVLRDLIIHNHLWEIEYCWQGSPPMILKKASKNQAFGDKKYIDRVNIKTRRTKALQLHVVPTRIDRRDLIKVFRTVWKSLIYLESKDRFQCYVSHLHIKFRRKTILFGQLLELVANTL